MEAGSTSDSLLIAMLFCTLKERNNLLAAHVKKNYSPTNPLYSLLMILLDHSDDVFLEDSIRGMILDSWRPQVAMILKNVDGFIGLNAQIGKFIDRLASCLLEERNDVYSHVVLKLINGSSCFRDVYHSHQHLLSEDL